MRRVLGALILFFLAAPLAHAQHPTLLTWTEPAGQTVTSFNVYRSTSSGTETFYASVSGSTSTFLDNAVTQGTLYFYFVTAVNSAGESGHSPEVSATVPPPHVVTGSNSISFGSVMVGGSSSASATLQNTGTAPVTIVSVALTTGTVYQITANACTGTLAPGATCTTTMTFTPTAIGTATDTLTYTDQYSGSSPATQPVGLTGVGTVAPPTFLSSPIVIG